MKALAYHGSKDVRVDSVPDPVMFEPDDLLLRVTATAICGSAPSLSGESPWNESLGR